MVSILSARNPLRNGRTVPHILSLALLIGAALSCGLKTSSLERVVFEKTLSLGLKKKCGGDKECLRVVETKLTECTDEAGWEKVLRSSGQDQGKAAREFNARLFPCLKDAKGRPIFGNRR